MIAPDSRIEIPAGYGGLVGVTSGSVTLEGGTGASNRITLESGDYALMLLGRGARLMQGLGSTPIEFSELVDQSAARVFGGAGASLLYGFFPSRDLGKNPFERVLPEIVHAMERSSPLLANAKSIVQLITEEQRSRFYGWQATVNQLVRVLVLQTLRTYVAGQLDMPRQANWLNATLDPTIGPVLARIHDEPERPWTVNSLARETKMAKSAFSERFREVVGEPPLQYLTGYRMQKACELLSESDLDVKEIATRSGYESASSFSNAFKRVIGKSPADFRKNSNQKLL